MRSFRTALLIRPRKHVLLILLAAALIIAGCAAAGKYADSGKSNRTATGFRNNYPQAPRASFIKWQWERWTQGLPKEPANHYQFPKISPDVAWLRTNRTVPSVTWIGHATALLQLGGMNILTDPMFSDRASPFSFIGPKRKVPLNITLAQLPHIDVVVISHNHYDHLDQTSVEALVAQQGGPPLFLVPLGVKDWMENVGIVNVRELDWWDNTVTGKLDMHFVPAQHWSARGLTDRAETLWGGWVIKTTGDDPHPFSIYFAGDTGYSKDFEDIGRKFGSIDVALIPIGAYAPRWFMQGQHVDPEHAVQIHLDVHAKRSVGIHWGSFELADEPLDEPPKLLAQAATRHGLPTDAFTVLRHGETLKWEHSALQK